MNLQKIDAAIEALCEQLLDIEQRVMPACANIENASKIAVAGAELGSSLAQLLTARKLYESEKETNNGR